MSFCFFALAQIANPVNRRARPTWTNGGLSSPGAAAAAVVVAGDAGYSPCSVADSCCGAGAVFGVVQGDSIHHPPDYALGFHSRPADGGRSLDHRGGDHQLPLAT